MKQLRKTAASSGLKRILLVDDHPLMREGLMLWIARAPELEVCGEAASAAQALELAEKLKPDLVLTDIALPGRDGLELIKDLRTLHPELPSVVLSMHEESLYAGRALRAGARGYVMKRAGGERIIEAIRKVLRGQIAVSSEMSTLLLEEYAGRRSQCGRHELPHLTDRELEILQLVGEAQSTREIASRLHLSPKTVETHRANLMRKLKLKNSPELLRFALQFAETGPAGG